MQMIDWGIVAALAVFLVVVGTRCLKYTTSVADYLAANRCAGRYVLGLSEGAAGVGAISFIAAFEMYYKAGFSIAWWGLLMVVVQIVAALSGWVTYRFRQTRAMTIAQFLEARYSRRF
ncbi:MAG: sodium:solute symporter family transporter, partial [Sedimentisphaerales bacterium]